jgi:hypothetical protein
LKLIVVPVVPEYDHRHSPTEIRPAGCERLAWGRSSNRQGEGKAKDGSDTHGSNLSAEPRSVGRISVNQIALPDYSTRFLLTGGNKYALHQFWTV